MFVNISHFVGECKRVKSSAARLESDNSSVSIATAGSMRKRERETERERVIFSAAALV